MRKNKAYLGQIGGDWFDDFVFMSQEPLKNMGFEIIKYDEDNLEDTLLCWPLDIEKDVIIGSVEACRAFFEGCGIETPKYLGYPEELKGFLGRNVSNLKFSDVYDIPTPFFIKPAEGVKKFTGALIDDHKSLQLFKDFDGVVDSDPVILSTPVEFLSEYRCFVHEGELKGIQHYAGDFKLFPNVRTIENMIKVYKSANCAYTLDVGVTPSYGTLLVEVNDMWAIGQYGFDAKTYTLMCVRRMREIGRQAKGETEPLWKKLKQHG